MSIRASKSRAASESSLAGIEVGGMARDVTAGSRGLS